MAQLNLKLSAQALNYLIEDAADTESLSEAVTSLLNTNDLLNNEYSYFDSWSASSTKAVTRFGDGSSRSYLGQITPTYESAYNEYGVANAHTVQLYVPAGIRETIKGNLIYDYVVDYDYLGIDFREGLITDYRVDIFGDLADPDHGNMSAGVTGRFESFSDGYVSGSLSSLYSSAQKILKRGIIEGDFQVSGYLQTAAVVTGTLQRMRNDFYDGSYVELRDNRPLSSTDSLSLLSLSQQELWSGEDTFNIELANTVTQTLYINSGAGNDNLTLKGGQGLLVADAGGDDDSIRLLDSAPVIFGGSGIDTIETAFSYSISNLGDIENLSLYGSKKANATGNNLDNTLTGNVAANILDGGIGADSMSGGKGNDTYIIDDAGDIITEAYTNALGGGIDTVKSSNSYELGLNLDHLILAGSDDINATGNVMANTLTGNGGANRLDGGEGIDKLIGGKGDDTYIVDLTATGTLQDRITELPTTATYDGGIDTVVLRGSYGEGLASSALAKTVNVITNTENLDISLTGASKLNLTGSKANNVLIGNDFGNIIIGGAGADTMTGGAGNDIFRFASLTDLGLGDGKQDVITDFVSGQDKLDFKALSGWKLVNEGSVNGTKQLWAESYSVETDSGTETGLILKGNSLGDTQADFSIRLIGVSELNASDIIFA